MISEGWLILIPTTIPTTSTSDGLKPHWDPAPLYLSVMSQNSLALAPTKFLYPSTLCELAERPMKNAKEDAHRLVAWTIGMMVFGIRFVGGGHRGWG